MLIINQFSGSAPFCQPTIQPWISFPHRGPRPRRQKRLNQSLQVSGGHWIHYQAVFILQRQLWHSWKIDAVAKMTKLQFCTLWLIGAIFCETFNFLLFYKNLSHFQTRYFWPSNCWAPENTDYAVYLCKRTMQNKVEFI